MSEIPKASWRPARIRAFFATCTLKEFWKTFSKHSSRYCIKPSCSCRALAGTFYCEKHLNNKCAAEIEQDFQEIKKEIEKNLLRIAENIRKEKEQPRNEIKRNSEFTRLKRYLKKLQEQIKKTDESKKVFKTEDKIKAAAKKREETLVEIARIKKEIYGDLVSAFK